MPLSRKINLVSVSTDGTAITVTDATGAYSGSNTTGYGSPNPATTAFTKLLFKISYMNGNASLLTISDSGIIAAFLAGGNVILTSLLADNVTGAYPFLDGVVTIDNYGLLASQTVSGVVGDKFITGSALTPFMAATHVVLADGTIYKIDTTKTQTSTTIYLTTDIKVVFTAARPAYIATTYTLVTVEFNCKLVNAIGGLAQGCDQLYDSTALSDLLVKKFSADFEFAAKDYAGADFTVKTALIKLNSMLNG